MPRHKALYLQLLAEQAQSFDCTVHAYVLMTNHVHLLLTPATPDAPSLLMKHLGQRYVQYINRTHHRSGTLWEGRFRSSIVDNRDYFLRCQQYIELNPVRAKIVDHPRDYKWSSYRCNAESERSTFLRPHAEYLALGADNSERAIAYRALFRGGLDASCVDEIRRAANGGFILGGDTFKQEIAAVLGRRVDRGVSGRPRKGPLENRGLSPVFV